MRTILLVLAALVLGAERAAAQGSCPPVPSWATGRAAAPACNLLVNAGPSFGTVTFDSRLENTVRGGQYSGPTCPTAGTNPPTGCATCNSLIAGSTIDNYLGGKNLDVLHLDHTVNPKYVLIRDSLLTNAWNCSGGAWSGPNGLSCAAGEVSTSHTDVMSYFTVPNDGGWIVVQHSNLFNGDQELSDQFTADMHRGSFTVAAQSGICTDPGPKGVLFQDVQLGNKDVSGAATHFIADCNARFNGGSFSCGSGNQIAIMEGKEGGHWDALWLVGVVNVSHNYIRVLNSVSRIIVIGGSGGSNGWPGPLGPTLRTGPGTCPDGILPGANYAESTTSTSAVYCYHTIEQALADGQVEPPFIRLSPVGFGGTPPPPDPNTPPPPQTLAISKLVLYDADTDTAINDPWTGQTIDLATHPNFAVDAIPTGGTPASVQFALDGTLISTQSSAPYAVNDNGPGDYLAFTPTPTVGAHQLRVTPINGSGTQGTTTTVNYTIANTTPVQTAIAKLILRDADTEAAINDPWTGQTIDIFVHPHYAVEAVPAGPTPASIVFRLDGVIAKTDKTAPFSNQDGATAGTFDPFTPTIATGNHTVIATPFTLANGAGSPGVPLQVAFALVNNTPPPPPPVTGPITRPIAARLAPGSTGVTVDVFQVGGIQIANDFPATVVQIDSVASDVWAVDLADVVGLSLDCIPRSYVVRFSPSGADCAATGQSALCKEERVSIGGPQCPASEASRVSFEFAKGALFAKQGITADMVGIYQKRVAPDVIRWRKIEFLGLDGVVNRTLWEVYSYAVVNGLVKTQCSVRTDQDPKNGLPSLANCPAVQ